MIKQEILKDFFEYLDFLYLNYNKLTVKNNITKEEKILTNLACLIEEVWEVASEVRKMTKLSFSKEKIKSFKIQDLEDEIVDVLITNLYLAKICWIEELNKDIIRKIKKNNDRWY